MQFWFVEILWLILFSQSRSMNWEMTMNLERKASRKLFCGREGELGVIQSVLYQVSGFFVPSLLKFSAYTIAFGSIPRTSVLNRTKVSLCPPVVSSYRA